MAPTAIRGNDGLNGATLRVLGGVLIGIGIAPTVVTVATIPVDSLLGAAVAGLFRPVVHFLAAVFGLVVLHLVRLFYPGNWRSLE